MKRCSVCKKIYFGERRYCPGCHTDLWYEEAREMRQDCVNLMARAKQLFREKKEEKAAVFAAEAVEEMLDPERSIPLAQLFDAAQLLARMYTSERGLIADELVEDMLDYLEEKLEISEDEPSLDSDTLSIKEERQQLLSSLRSQVGSYIPEAANIEEEEIGLPVQRQFWRLPEPQDVLHGSDDEFEADLTRTKGFSLAETGFLFYRKHKHILSVVRVMEETQSLLDSLQEGEEEDIEYRREEAKKSIESQEKRIKDMLFTGVLRDISSAGPASDAFVLLMHYFSKEGQEAVRNLYAGQFSAQSLEILDEACEIAAERAGLYPTALCFLALAAPMLSLEEKASQLIYEAMEQDMREVLSLIEEAQKDLRNPEIEEDDRQYKCQLIQTLCTEYSNIIAIGEYQKAQEFIKRGAIYKSLLESAAGNGLSLACAQAAHNWFYGENGYEVHLEYAKYYAVILKLRELSYSVAESIEQIKNLQVEIPGMLRED